MTKIKIIISSIFVVFFYTYGHGVEFKGEFIQGHFILAKTSIAKKVLSGIL